MTGLDEQSQFFTDLHEMKQAVNNYLPQGNYLADSFALEVCKLALEAVNEGNFGIGALLVDKEGQVVATGHNQVFVPHFRSDLHAEMVVMNRFEGDHQGLTRLKGQGYTLYTSLEPCPMCLTRLIFSGVNNVRYVAPDPKGGMVEKMRDLPAFLTGMRPDQTFAQANCSPQLTDIAGRIFALNAQALNEKLMHR